MSTTKRPRKKAAATTASTTKKPRRTTTKTAASAEKAKATRTRKTAAKARTKAQPAEEIRETAPVETALPAVSEATPAAPAEVIITAIPEPAFAARVPSPEPPRPRPATRRGVFFDVENTSRAEDIGRVLRYLDLDWVNVCTEFMAIGNWRVIGHDTARLLAGCGAKLVHSAPSAGVRDWSDLRIAVSAGVWLASAHPGDTIEIVSDDQAFDAVGDVATSLGVGFRRTSYRSLAGLPEFAMPEGAEARPRRSRRGGRGRPTSERGRSGERYGRSESSGGRHPAPARTAERHAPVHRPAPAVVQGEQPHTAPHDEIVGVVRDLMATAPGGISLDALANALKSRGFARPPGSPRLITRLRRIRELEVGRSGLIRLKAEGEEAAAAPRPAEPAEAAPVVETTTVVAEPAPVRAPASRPRHDWWSASHPLETPEPEPEQTDVEESPRALALGIREVGALADVGGDDLGLAEDEAGEDLEDDLELAPGEADGEGGGEPAAGGEGGATRRRRRRGGRRRRGRRGGASAAAPAPEGIS